MQLPTQFSAKPLSASHDLLIVQRSEATSPKLIESLRRKGFTLKTIAASEDPHGHLITMANPILIADCGAQKGCHDFMARLVLRSELLTYPLLVLGRDIDGLEQEMTEHFGLAVALRTPCKPGDVIEMLSYISRNYTRDDAMSRRAARRKSQTPTPEPEVALPLTQPFEDAKAHQAPNELYDQKDSIPNALFQKLAEFDLIRNRIGGFDYPRLGGAIDLDFSQLLSNERRNLDALRKVLAQHDLWTKGHLLRSAYLSRLILKPISADEDLRDNAAAAAILMALSFSKKTKVFLRKPYFGRGTLLLRKEIANLIKDSAFQLTSSLQLVQEADLVATMARLLGREEIISDEPASVAASAIMAADITDRICFQKGTWDSRAAHGLLRAIRAGDTRDIHPAVLCCVVKLLSEAVAGFTLMHLVHKNIRDNPELQARARREREITVDNHEEKVDLAALAPGMRLSRPLFTFDGCQILEDDLLLDQDLIWRIWQLSAIRPLNGPATIFRSQRME